MVASSTHSHRGKDAIAKCTARHPGAHDHRRPCGHRRCHRVLSWHRRQSPDRRRVCRHEDEELTKDLDNIGVIARVAQKTRSPVDLLQRKQNIVA